MMSLKSLMNTLVMALALIIGMVIPPTLAAGYVTFRSAERADGGRLLIAGIALALCGLL